MREKRRLHGRRRSERRRRRWETWGRAAGRQEQSGGFFRWGRAQSEPPKQQQRARAAPRPREIGLICEVGASIFLNFISFSTSLQLEQPEDSFTQPRMTRFPGPCATFRPEEPRRKEPPETVKQRDAAELKASSLMSSVMRQIVRPPMRDRWGRHVEAISGLKHGFKEVAWLMEDSLGSQNCSERRLPGAARQCSRGGRLPQFNGWTSFVPKW